MAVSAKRIEISILAGLLRRCETERPWNTPGVEKCRCSGFFGAAKSRCCASQPRNYFPADIDFPDKAKGDKKLAGNATADYEAVGED